jgi:hypothetical protein
MTLKAKFGLVAATALVVGAVGGYCVGSLACGQGPKTDADQDEQMRVLNLANATVRVSNFTHLLKGFRAGERELMIDRLESLLDFALVDLGRDYAAARDPFDAGAKVIRLANDYRTQYPYRNALTNVARQVGATLSIKIKESK